MELANDTIAVLKDHYDLLRLHYDKFNEEQLEEIETLAGKIQYFALEGKTFDGRIESPDLELMNQKLNVNNIIFQT